MAQQSEVFQGGPSWKHRVCLSFLPPKGLRGAGKPGHPLAPPCPTCLCFQKAWPGKTQSMSSQAPFLSKFLEDVLHQNKWETWENKTGFTPRCSERKAKVTKKEKEVPLGQLGAELKGFQEPGLEQGCLRGAHAAPGAAHTRSRSHAANASSTHTCTCFCRCTTL